MTERGAVGLDDVVARHSGVVSRRQLVGLGGAPNDVRRLLRRRELVVVLPGVYLDHTVQSRRTTAPRLQVAPSGRSRIARRQLLGQVIADVGGGACSVLERGYLTKVERPHGLPVAGAPGTVTATRNAISTRRSVAG